MAVVAGEQRHFSAEGQHRCPSAVLAEGDVDACQATHAENEQREEID